jgi:hypothetical protein
MATAIAPFPASTPSEPERWNPKLKLVREILLGRNPEVVPVSVELEVAVPA